jgi:hypothetical protein
MTPMAEVAVCLHRLLHGYHVHLAAVDDRLQESKGGAHPLVPGPVNCKGWVQVWHGRPQRAEECGR